MTNFQALRERVRAAPGPDRELDLRIWAEAEGLDVRRDFIPHWGLQGLLGKRRDAPHDESVLGVFTPQNEFNTVGLLPSPDYLTASIDASLALVEQLLPGWGWTVEGGEAPFVGILDWNGGGPKQDREYRSIGSTPSLAILDALLTALIQE